MKRWYEPKKNRPDLTRERVSRRGFAGFMEMLWREFFELLKLNLLFILTCIPVITIPAAMAAMHHITVTMVEDKNHFLWQDYWRIFKRDFVKATLGGLIYAVAIAIFVLSTYFYYNLMAWHMLTVIFAGLSACLLILIVMSSMYFFPMLVRVELKLKPLLKNAVFMTFANIKRSLLAFLWLVIFLGAGIGLLPLSALYGLLIMFSFSAFIVDYVVWPPIRDQVIAAPAEDHTGEMYEELENTEKQQELHSASIDELDFEEEE
ncbi:MAG: DUF624 domain-containing protein [Clostridia bacterium]|nr:DUF624 domain-containing protein [Clostridia bacterium]